MAAPLSDACCDRTKVSSNYVPQGKMDKIGSVDVYRTGPHSDRVILHLYDIFAFTNNNKQVADLLAQRSSCTVIMPDLLLGGWKGEFPVQNREILVTWINNDCTWEKTSGRLEEVVSHLKDKKIGVAGFCWGGMASIKAVGKIPAVRAAALIHPSRVTLEDCEVVHGPVLFLPSKDEPDMKPCFEAVQKKPFGSLAEHHRFDDMHHGWCATRGNFADENNAKRAMDAIDLIASFYTKVFNDKSTL